MKFASRWAAWTAAFLVDHARAHGAVKVLPNIDGSVVVHKLGARYKLSLTKGTLRADLIYDRPKPKPKAEISIPGSADLFAGRGDQWNAQNAWHDAYKHAGSVRTDPDGTRTLREDKPTVEGYDQYGPLRSKETHVSAEAVVRSDPECRRRATRIMRVNKILRKEILHVR